MIPFSARSPNVTENDLTVVNQMDTSGTNLGEKKATSSKPDQYSKDELAAILKFGASNLFASTVDQTKLEEMDLDDVINKAEAYETDNAPTGTSLGGEGFLNQFAVQDVKADLTTWADIIPQADRAEMEAARALEFKPEEDFDMRRAATRLPSGAYHRDGIGRDTLASADARFDIKPKITIRRTEEQRAVDLTDRDIRTLIRGLQHFGDIRYRYDAIVKDARLESKNRTVIMKVVDELLVKCRSALEARKLEDGQSRASGEGAPVKAKAVLVTYKGVDKINAETVVQRVDELKVLDESSFILFIISEYVADHSYRSSQPQEARSVGVPDDFDKIADELDVRLGCSRRRQSHDRCLATWPRIMGSDSKGRLSRT